MPVLAARGLGFTYHRSAGPALSGLDLEAGSGELVLLAGPSGGGKSTAALGLAGLLGEAVPGDVQGRVSLGGRTILGDGADRRPGEVGLVLQDPEAHLVTLKVEDEVAFGPENLCLPPEEVRRRIEGALDSVRGRHLASRSTSELSGGEKQRVALASVLAMAPGALVLDEPTANLDPPARSEVLSAVLGLVEGGERPLVVAEHRLDALLEAATRVVVLDGGRTAWSGAPADVMAEAEPLADLGVRIPGRGDLLGLERPRAKVGGPVLAVAGLVTGFGGREVLAGADLEVRAGELVALVGPNGGGKTTLLRCIMGLQPIWDGTVEVSGLDASTSLTSELARRVGMVFQSPNHQLFESSVRRELEFGPRNLGLLDGGTERRIGELAQAFGLAQLMDTHPFRLSHGQKRRLNVASAEASSPGLLLLDEPFIGQDIRSVRALNDRLQEARRGGTAVVVVSHDLEALALMADRAVVVEGGRCRELGDPEGLKGAAAGWAS